MAALLLVCIASCKKSADAASQISLSASTTQTTTGQVVAVTLSSSVNASRWTVSPSTATKTYTVTTSKVNYITFSQPGTYTVSVSAKALNYDSTHQSLDSLWNHTGVHTCTNGIDSASLKISVLK
jgi:lipopolysaccharide export system protein LptA